MLQIFFSGWFLYQTKFLTCFLLNELLAFFDGNCLAVLLLQCNLHCKCLQGITGTYREIGVREFQIYGDCMYTRNPCNFEIPHSYFHCNICREFDFTGILWGFPALDVGKPCNNLIFLRYPCKICRDNL